jgi:hypothetical protein
MRPKSQRGKNINRQSPEFGKKVEGGELELHRSRESLERCYHTWKTTETHDSGYISLRVYDILTTSWIFPEL